MKEMKIFTNTFKCLFFVIFILSFSVINAMEYIADLPTETAMLKLSKDGYKEWKEISRFLSEKEGVVEYIPSDQKKDNWSELIAVQFIGLPPLDNDPNRIDDIATTILDTMVKKYPKEIFSWKVLERNNGNIIYEWILHKPFKNIPSQHEISRIFLTEKGVQRVGFTRRYGQMSQTEKENWIENLKKDVSIIKLVEADPTKGLSLADRYKDSLDLGPFSEWAPKSTYIFKNGYTQVCRIPSSQIGEEYIMECLEVTTMADFNDIAVDQFIEAEKRFIKDKKSDIAKFSVLKRSPTEIIYSYVHPHENSDLQVTGIVRVFIINHGYYSIAYKRGLPKKLTDKQIQHWQKQLEAIKIK